MNIDEKSLLACYSLLQQGPETLSNLVGRSAGGGLIYSPRNWRETLEGRRWPIKKLDIIAERLEVDPMDLLSAICQYRKNSRSLTKNVLGD